MTDIWEVSYAYSAGYQATTCHYGPDYRSAVAEYGRLAARVGWDQDYAWVQLAHNGVERKLTTCETEATGYHPIPPSSTAVQP